MKKYRYNIYNLDCPNCAKKIEEELNKKDYLKNVNINFISKKISYETNKNITLKELNNLIKEIEPQCLVKDDNQINDKKEYNINILLIAISIFILGKYTKINEITPIIAYIILLYKPCKIAILNLKKNKSINENALITISCIGAYFLNEIEEGIMVVSLYIIGKILEEKAINNSRREIKDLIGLKQDYVNKKEDNQIIKIKSEQIKKDDIILIKVGEQIPTDGIIIKGNTKLDMQALTGETELKEVKENDEVLSGSINTENIIEIKSQKNYEDTTVSKILNLIEESSDKKAKTETTISKISKIYTPTVLILAILVFVILPLIINITYKESLYRALSFLVISCPCAIAISIPLAYFTALGISSKNKILIKGSNYLDNLNNINTIIFDKTGTLTNGRFEVEKIDIIDKKYTENKIIDIITKGEAYSNHPIALSIQKLTSKKSSNINIENYKELSGKGITYCYEDLEIKLGNNKICNCKINTDVHLNINNNHIASIYINDGIKEKVAEEILKLKEMNIKIYMFTGDKKEIAEEIGKRTNIDNVTYEMLPTDKYKEYEKISKNNINIAFVGDGINDTPVLKRATTGISMGNIGSSAAIEASDIVIMNDDISKIRLAIEISKYTNKIIKQNLIFALIIKLSILILSILGITTMWFAVFADTGLTLINISNTLRIIKKYK